MQAPDVPSLRTVIALPAVPAPHPGTSYNPPETAHTALLCAAHEAEVRRAQEAAALEATKARILGARRAVGGDDDGGAQGMLIDKPGAGADQSQDAAEQRYSDPSGLESANAARKLVPQRKTKQQRRKAEKLCAEVHHQPRPILLSCMKHK